MTNRIFLEITERVPFADGYEFEGAGATKGWRVARILPLIRKCLPMLVFVT